MCVTYWRVLDWWPDLLHIYTTCYYTSQTTIWHTMSSLLNHLRLPSQETPSIFIQPALDPRYITSGRPPQKTPFPNNSSIIIEARLSRHGIEIVVLLFLCACLFPRESVYRVVAYIWTSTLAPLFRLSGVMSYYLILYDRNISGFNSM
jgi:hypothetical protein